MLTRIKKVICTIPHGVISKVAIYSFIAGFIVALSYFLFVK